MSQPSDPQSIPVPKLAPFSADCVTDESVRELAESIEIPGCDLPDIAEAPLVITAGRRSTLHVEPPPPACLSPCPPPLTYMPIGDLRARVFLDPVLDPIDQRLLDTYSGNPLDEYPESPTSVTVDVAANALTYLYLVYDSVSGGLVSPAGGSTGKLHVSTESPKLLGMTEGAYTTLLLHRIDTRGASAEEQVIKCPPGVRVPPQGTTFQRPDTLHPFQLVRSGCGFKINLGTVNGMVPFLLGTQLTDLSSAQVIEPASDVSVWLRIHFTYSEESGVSIADPSHVSILLENYAASFSSGFYDGYIRIGRVSITTDDSDNCIVRTWNDVRTNLLHDKCGVTHSWRRV